MVLCSKCKKRPAAVFMSRIENGVTKNDGICIVCAKELGIQPVNDMLDKMGITDDMFDEITNEIDTMMENDAFGDMFESGGASILPIGDNGIPLGVFNADNGAVNNELPENNSDDSSEKSSDTKEKNDKNKQKGKNKDEKTKFLSSFCTNLTEQARDGKLDKIIGRDDEIFRVMQILNRRSKNNPCLIGEPGVGKTAIAEGLALRIVNKNAPSKLLSKEIHLVDLAAMVAGTQFRGQFESRIKGLIDEVKRLGNIILVIDEVHNIVKAGDADGAMNAGNILKPALSRGEIQVIGATTFNEYRKHIEKDSALERRFQPITVNEPSVENTFTILKGIKSYYETHHHVFIDDITLHHAVRLSERYITDRFLPDKAIDLMDEACSLVNLTDSTSSETDVILAKLSEYNKSVEELTDDGSTEYYEKHAMLLSEILRLNERAAVLTKNPARLTIEHLSKVIELWTGIPATKVKETEFGRLNTLADDLKKHIIGQDKAVGAVSSAIVRNRAGLALKQRPASFIFAGPTGVGKTELVKQLSYILFDSPESLIRLDMSEFMEKFSLSRIIGSPPGYVGYDEAGQLTEKIRRKPYSVVLFDEIEKAHPDVMNILLQILDDGHITDAQGRHINFENTVIVMTTNAGSENKNSIAGFGELDVMSEDATLKALKDFLRPEFLNRVDEIVVFSHLNKENNTQICRLMLDELEKGLNEKSIQLKYDENVLDFIVEKAFSHIYGARNLRRFIQKEIEDRIAMMLISSYDLVVNSVSVSVKDDAVFVH